jgi:chorismate mutase
MSKIETRTQRILMTTTSTSGAGSKGSSYSKPTTTTKRTKKQMKYTPPLTSSFTADVRYLSTRNKTDREEKVREELEELKRKNPSARESMNDVMKEIGQMSRQDWLSIPDIGDRAYKKVAAA